MKQTEPLALHHSWPIFEDGRRFDLGWANDLVALTLPGFSAFPIDVQTLARRGIGRWSCDLRDNMLTWSAEVFDLFGLPRHARPSRADTVALYAEGSRAAMERLRAHAIRHRRGFTLDAQIVPAQGERRWVRLMAAPIVENDRVTRLHGLKQDVSHEYR